VHFASRYGRFAICPPASVRRWLLANCQWQTTYIQNCGRGMAVAPGGGFRCLPAPFGELYMNLAIWLPALFILGLATMGLMFAFMEACERV
jgi:hypothetical protein